MTKVITSISRGDVVALPTETVYGLCARADNEKAIHKVFELKKRPLSIPFTIMIPCFREATKWAREISPTGWLLAEKFLPGPLTMVFKAQSHVSKTITANKQTIGLRIPAHPTTQAILQKLKHAIVAPSANPHGTSSPRSADEVLQYFKNKDMIILDGGECAIGKASTVLDLSKNIPEILRHGSLPANDIAKVLKQQKIQLLT